MMKKPVLAALAAVSLAFVASAKGPTRVQFWFDTEDYTCDKSNDALRDIANILSEEGVRGHFNVVGQLAKFILDNRRFDVIEALKPHLVGTQTLYHSRHPNITELTDLDDYDEAYRLCLAEEAIGLGYLKAAFGFDRLLFSCYPGNGSSYVALDVHSDLGATFQGGLGAFDNLKEGDAVWYQNMRQILYNAPLSLENLIPGGNLISEDELSKRLDRLAGFDAFVIYMHPDMAVRGQHWDIENYEKGNLVEFGKWNPPNMRDPANTAQFYANLHRFLRRLKADKRFVITDCEQLVAAQKPRVAITPKDVPAIRASLLKAFGPVREPASWSVADCFQAAVKFLRGEVEHQPGKVYGFLEKPVGVTAPVTVKTADLKAAAEKIGFRRHLPVRYEVGGVTLGPADFLFAALEALETGKDEVVVEPKEQLGDIATRLPKLANFSHVKPGWIIYWPEFKDRYLADRLRWQYWTMRYE